VTSVDSTNYSSVVFKIEYTYTDEDTGASSTTVKSYSALNFYEKISEVLGLEAMNDPKAEFSADSLYFASKKATLSDADAFGTEISVHAELTLLDGTVVTGDTAVFTVVIPE
ncbi:MAG: hypothetical protein J5879_02765, partial [Clostridia bacterium]|nr:hypothetical protein [Clostridia bacterium]